MQDLAFPITELITGGSNGNGLAIANKFSIEKIKVITADIAEYIEKDAKILSKKCIVLKAELVEELFTYSTNTTGLPKNLVISFEGQVEDFSEANITSRKGTAINLNCPWNISAEREAEIEAKFSGTKGGAAFKNVEGTFYDFTSEKYSVTKTEVLVTLPDEWSRRAGVIYAGKALSGQKYDHQIANELILTAELIDRTYGK